MYDIDSVCRALRNTHLCLQCRSQHFVSIGFRIGLHIRLVRWNHRCKQLHLELGLSGMRGSYGRPGLSWRYNTSRNLDCHRRTMEHRGRDRFPCFFECWRCYPRTRSRIKYYRFK